MLMNFVRPEMLVLFFEGRLKEVLETFAEALGCSMEELTIFFRASKEQEVVAQVFYEKKRVETIPILPIFEQTIKGVLQQVPEQLLDLVEGFQKDYGKDLEEAFANKEATNQALCQLIKRGTLIVKYKEGQFVYALKKKKGEKAQQVQLVHYLTKENLQKVTQHYQTQATTAPQ